MFVKKFDNKDIYTITGHYFGKVKDIILNFKTGDISKVSVLRTVNVEKEYIDKGFIGNLLDSFDIPEEPSQHKAIDLVNIDFHRIIAIGDVLIVNI